MTFRLPDDTQHLAIIGRNGSGKTQAALWHLSKRSFDLRPWIIVDFKRDVHIAAISGAEEIAPGIIPDKPGIYVVRPNASNPQPLGETLSAAYERGNVGLWFDEGFMVGKDKKVEAVFEDLLTQGRSKRIPLIVLVQRPVWVSRFVFSESSFFQLFHLQDKRDVQTVSAVIPEDAIERLPEFHSLWYDVSRDERVYLAPVPGEDEILASIESRLAEMREKEKRKSWPKFL